MERFRRIIPLDFTFILSPKLLVCVSPILSSVGLRSMATSVAISRSSSFQHVNESPFSHQDVYGARGTWPAKCGKTSSDKKSRRHSKKNSKSSSPSTRHGKKKKYSKDKHHSPASDSYHTSSSHHNSSSLSSAKKLKMADIDQSSPTKPRHKSSTAVLPIIAMKGKLSNNCTSLHTQSAIATEIEKNSRARIKRNQTLMNFSHTPVPLKPVIKSCISLNLSRMMSSSGGLRQAMPFRQGGSVCDGSCGQLTIEDIGNGLAMNKYKKVVIMSGAGISTASGIPDFRTPGTGLYDNLKKYRIPEPSAIFDISYFFHNPRPFFTLAKELYPGRYSPNIVHYFVRLLQERGVLLRNYTQNIDGLERLAGVVPGRLVEAHGSFSSASCTVCRTKHDPEHTKELIYSDKIPRCKHKFCSGVVKPDIVFFGEDLPQRFHSLRHMDLSQCDLLIIMGTSLEVEPFASLATLTRFNVPRVLLNREVVGLFKHQRRRVGDVVLTGDLVELVGRLIKMAGWEGDLDRLRATGTSKPSSSTVRDVGDIGQSTSDYSSLEKISPSVSVAEVGTKDATAIDTQAVANSNELVHKMSHLKLVDDS